MFVLLVMVRAGISTVKVRSKVFSLSYLDMAVRLEHSLNAECTVPEK